MKLFYLNTTVILVVLGISVSNSIPLDRLKRALHEPESPQEDERIPSEVQRRVAPDISTRLGGGKNKQCVPGVWTCLQSNPPAPDDVAVSYDRDHASQPEDVLQGPNDRRSPAITSDNDNDNAELNNDTKKCPPGIWVCGKKKRSEMMKKLRRALRRF